MPLIIIYKELKEWTNVILICVFVYLQQVFVIGIGCSFQYFQSLTWTLNKISSFAKRRQNPLSHLAAFTMPVPVYETRDNTTWYQRCIKVAVFTKSLFKIYMKQNCYKWKYLHTAPILHSMAELCFKFIHNKTSFYV